MNRRQITGMIIACAILAVCFSPWFEHWVTFPEQVRLMAGIPYQLRLPLPFGLSVTVDQPGLMINDQLLEPHQWRAERGSCALYAHQPGSMQMQLKLFGLLPLRRLSVEVIPPIEVVPAGQSIGVTIKATTMVVGYASVQTAGGSVQPAKNAGLQLGDLVLAVNDRPDPSTATVAEEVIRSGEAGEPVRFLIQREQQQLRISVQPTLCKQSQRHRIGLYVRDDAAGVGTLTFVDRESKTFAALGHIIADIDTNQALQVKDGRIMRSSVTAIDQGRSGHPGEKRSIMVDQETVIGVFTTNTGIGIFGELLQDVTTGTSTTPVALVDQVQPGPAEIWTVIEGERVEKFQIEIVRVSQQFSPGGKGMVIKVTDPVLLQKTGGIVQGMSGSPIIQGGKLVGAVTHVFVNKPDTGYGVFAEWMVRESGLVEKREQLAPTFFYRKYLSASGL
ncbi:MAG: SpoIVB peptidase [Bacillota bacterium]|jgi:stage IV sporulation protein B